MSSTSAAAQLWALEQAMEVRTWKMDRKKSLTEFGLAGLGEDIRRLEKQIELIEEFEQRERDAYSSCKPALRLTKESVAERSQRETTEEMAENEAHITAKQLAATRAEL
jgi:hypothetical protein